MTKSRPAARALNDGPRPLQQARSKWTPTEVIPDAGAPGVTAVWLTRNVSDGTLIACVAEEPAGWHLSISFRNHRGDHSRYPNFDEQMDAIRTLLPVDRTYVMIVPPDERYIAVHPTTFHWHEWEEGMPQWHERV